MMLWRSISVWDYLTGPQTTLTVIIIPVLTSPGNCGTCSVGQVIRATPSKTHPWSGWSSAVWFQPSHWAHSTPSSGKEPARAEKSHMTLMGFEPQTFRPTVRRANHCATGAGILLHLVPHKTVALTPTRTINIQIHIKHLTLSQLPLRVLSYQRFHGTLYLTKW